MGKSEPVAPRQPDTRHGGRPPSGLAYCFRCKSEHPWKERCPDKPVRDWPAHAYAFGDD